MFGPLNVNEVFLGAFIASKYHQINLFTWSQSQLEYHHQAPHRKTKVLNVDAKVCTSIGEV